MRLRSVLFVAAALLAQSVHAGVITMHNGYGSDPGGEFDVNVINGSGLPYQFNSSIRLATSGSEFSTFCLERNEFIAFGVTYYTTVSDRAMSGGMGGQEAGGGDPLSIQTAYLYSNFARGTLSGYNYGSGAARTNSATALQNAFWFLENEWIVGGNSNYTPSAALALSVFGPGLTYSFIHSAFQNATGLDGVEVMNLWTSPDGRGNSQSQLILVPVPGAVLLGALGLGVAIWIKRRQLG